MAKGADNERMKCKEWSLWWTEGKRDDVFWRTSGSGARARVRANAGLYTHAMFGDMHSVDEEGLPLTETCVFEFKKGYSEINILDCLDSKQKAPLLHTFIDQVLKDAHDGGGLYPCLIIHRDYRKPVIFIPAELYCKLSLYFGGLKNSEPVLKYYYRERFWVGLRQSAFFEWANPAFFHDLYKQKKGQRTQWQRKRTGKKLRV